MARHKHYHTRKPLTPIPETVKIMCGSRAAVLLCDTPTGATKPKKYCSQCFGPAADYQGQHTYADKHRTPVNANARQRRKERIDQTLWDTPTQ